MIWPRWKWRCMSFFLCMGTQHVLEGHYDHARDYAAYARHIEQHIALHLKQTQALHNLPKIKETFNADMHTLLKFLQRRIPCSCLDGKCEEVKSITKLGVCYNPQCHIPYAKVERSNTRYCSRCRCATYCSRECQEFDWSRHKHWCDNDAAVKAEFEAKQHNNV